MIDIEKALRGAAILVNKPRVSRAQLARLIGVGRSQVYRWERKEATPRKQHAKKLLSLGVLANMVDNLRSAVREELEE